MYSFYEKPVFDTSFLQGDIVNNLFFPSAISESTIIDGRDAPISTIASPLSNNEPVKIDIHQETGMIISQTCDVQRCDRGDLILVCPVRKIQTLKDILLESKNPNTVENFIYQIKEKKIQYYFHLPAENNFEESYADLTTIVSINKTLLNIDNRMLSLSAYSRHWLQYTLSAFLGRPFDQNK